MVTGTNTFPWPRQLAAAIFVVQATWRQQPARKVRHTDQEIAGECSATCRTLLWTPMCSAIPSSESSRDARRGLMSSSENRRRLPLLLGLVL